MKLKLDLSLKGIDTKAGKLESINPSDYISNSAISGLGAYFGNSIKGRSDEIRSPLFKSMPFIKVLDNWKDKCSKLKPKYPGLYEFELEMASKAGPLSIQFPAQDRLQSVFDYYPALISNSVPVRDEAVNHVLDDLISIRGISLKSPENTLSSMKLNTNSGLPLFTRKSKVLNSVPAVIERGSGSSDYTITDPYGMQ